MRLRISTELEVDKSNLSSHKQIHVYERLLSSCFCLKESKLKRKGAVDVASGKPDQVIHKCLMEQLATIYTNIWKSNLETIALSKYCHFEQMQTSFHKINKSNKKKILIITYNLYWEKEKLMDFD